MKPLENARFQVTSGTTDPPAEKPIPLTEITKNDLILIHKMSPPSLSKFDIEDGVKLVAIIAMSDFTQDYLIKQKIIPNNI